MRAGAADLHLAVAIDKEACPLNLAPTASSTATLALGDALAMALQEARGFTPADFARFHPGGRLGKQLLRVAEIMHAGEKLPMVTTATPMSRNRGSMMFSQWPGLASQPATTSSADCGPSAMFSPVSFDR